MMKRFLTNKYVIGITSILVIFVFCFLVLIVYVNINDILRQKCIKENGTTVNNEFGLFEKCIR